jgi:hypothetical protein
MRYIKTFLYALILAGSACSSNDATTSMDSVGQGGSTTRYTIQNNYLYVVTNVSLKVFDISGNNFTQVGAQEVGFGVETIFSRPDYLYLGSNDGMYIYKLEDPVSPEFAFKYEHIVACDPVVVQGNRAYVTLSSGVGSCNRDVNELHIIDITDRYNPQLITQFVMSSPHGLGVDGNYAFISEGEFGLKVLDISDEHNIQTIETITEINAFDVIARANRLTVTGEDGIFQYSYPSAEGDFLTLLSKIPVIRQ